MCLFGQMIHQIGAGIGGLSAELGVGQAPDVKHVDSRFAGTQVFHLMLAFELAHLLHLFHHFLT